MTFESNATGACRCWGSSSGRRRLTGPIPGPAVCRFRATPCRICGAARKDRRRLVPGCRVVHPKRELEGRAHGRVGVQRAVVRGGRRRNPVRGARAGRERRAKPKRQRPVGVLGQLIGGELRRSELSDRFDDPVGERAGTGARAQIDDGTGIAAGPLDRDLAGRQGLEPLRADLERVRLVDKARRTAGAAGVAGVGGHVIDRPFTRRPRAPPSRWRTGGGSCSSPRLP